MTKPAGAIPVRALIVGAVGLVVLGLIGAVAMVMIAGTMDTGEGSGGGSCAPGGIVPVGDTSGPAVAGLDSEQSENARIIIQVGRSMKVPPKGLVVAIATARQESGIRNLNYGDRDSLGLFQQRPSSGWGTPAQVTDPVYASRKFYNALLAVPGWEDMTVTVAAQTVQRSAYPDAYAQWQALAEAVVAGVLGTSTDDLAIDTAAAAVCPDPVAAGGPVVYPVPQGYIGSDRHNYGGQGGMWSSYHTGTDFSVPCGTPVLAATAGTIVVDTSQGWAGRWLVKVTTGAGKLTTWYAHMQALNVSDGDVVAAGQQIGQVGALGNATGCHLHFEVHPHGGGIYEDGVNPSPWLAENVGKVLPGQAVPASTGGDGSFVIASFNVLGASHTGPGGKAPGMASGAARMAGVVALLDQHRIDVVGFQEFQGSQADAFTQRAGSLFGTWHPGSDTENSIAWRKSAWTFVSGQSVGIPYFDGHTRRMPVVQLRSNDTGQTAWFGNFHNPADTARYHNQQRYRLAATRIEVALAAQLRPTGDPVFFTGDFNERASFFCRITANGQMRAAAGGSTGTPCQPPAYGGIDWILGSANLTFTGWNVDRSPVGSVSDHPLVYATVQ